MTPEDTTAAAARAERFKVAITEAGECLVRKDFEACEAAIARAEEIAPNHPEILHFRGLSLFEQRQTVEAFRLVLQSAQAQPRNHAVLHNLSAIQISLGHFKDAEQNLMKAVRLNPAYAEAFHTLAGIHKFTAEDPLIGMMEDLAQRGQFSPKDASFLCFALAKAYDDAGLPDRAWPMLEQANAQMDLGYEGAREDREIRETLEICTPDLLEEKRRYGHPSPAPIFVVGMPRSGTTLLESLLGDHPQVHAAGELAVVPALGRTLAERNDLPAFRHGHGPAVAALKPAHLHGSGLGYLNEVRKAPRVWFDHVVDKLPDNSLNLGLINVMLPNARVVHIMRHPLDVMLSIYFQRFTSVPYGFRPADIVSHWKNYTRAMDHWRDVLPDDTLLELRYENLVQDTDFARSLLWSSLGLTEEVDHVPGMHSAGEQRTASRWQVKQPVYGTSRQKFRKYQAHMTDFIDALGGMAAIEREVAVQEDRCALRRAAETVTDTEDGTGPAPETDGRAVRV